MLSLDVGHRISVYEDSEHMALPDWAASLVWLGDWCRTNQVEGKRLIVFTVLPTRELAAAFAGLGSLLSGAKSFEDTLSWPVFRKLPIGSNVFWIDKGRGTHYGGSILGFYNDQESEFIKLKITKSPKKGDSGATWTINKRFFSEYSFTVNRPPSAIKSKIYTAAETALGKLVANLNPKWIWSDDAECLLITSVSSFENSIENLSLSIDGSQSIKLSNILCMARNGDKAHAKLRVDHPRGAIEGSFPLAILDGNRAFMMNEHLHEVRNMLIILDRLEYQTGIHDIAKMLRSYSHERDAALAGSIPSLFIHGIEIAAYLIDSI